MTTQLVIFGLLLMAACTQGNCQAGYRPLGSYCYAYIDHKMSWVDAMTTCGALGGFLAEALTKDMGKFLHDMAKDNGSHTIWLGADDLLVQGLWTWATSGKALDYTDWYHGQPENDPTDDENCLAMNFARFEGQWVEDECEHEHRFICKKRSNNHTVR